MRRNVFNLNFRKNNLICIFIISAITLFTINAVNDINLNSTMNDFENDPFIDSAPDLESSYLPINDDGHFPLGNISVVDITRMGDPILSPDTITGIGQKNLSYTYHGYEFLGVDTLGTDDTVNWDFNAGYLTIIVNESFTFDYWDNFTKREIGYKSALYSGELVDVTVNGTSDIEDAYVDGNDVFRYNYSDYHELNNNGTLNLGFLVHHNISIYDWEVYQQDRWRGNNLYEAIEDAQLQLNAFYNYTFILGDSSLNFTAEFLVNPPDQNYLSNVGLTNFTGTVDDPTILECDSYTKTSNNSIKFTTDVDGNKYSINFNTTFTLEMKEPNLPFLWSMDNLYYGRRSRERIYEISCVEGPSELPISNFYLNDSYLPYTSEITLDSELDRPVFLSNMSYTDENGVHIGPEGTTLNCSFDNGHYLVKGETDKITLKYTADYKINILMLDSVSFPVRGASVKLYYRNVSYGTVMSQAQTYQVAPKKTENNGQVIISDLPYGVYTLAIYYRGSFVQNVTLTTSSTINILNTTIPHFPTTILVFGGISAGILLVGLYLYKKNVN